MVKIEIIDASYPKPARYTLTVEGSITVGEALAQTPFDWQNRAIGIYGRFVGLDTVLEQDSRLEMYQALWIDPKQARRARANRHKKALTSPLP
jgi:putative ubiquitin-RnfH superfamily antitoxin RatB of RatAB toxin-antitoxin module